MDRPAIARIFEEWQRQYHDDPDAFLSHDEADAQDPPTYGEQAADTFLRIATELDNGTATTTD
jgi:hypothetical protein